MSHLSKNRKKTKVFKAIPCISTYIAYGTKQIRKGKIYKIVDCGYNLCYYGSTCQELCHRMANHRLGYEAYQQKKTCLIRSYFIFDEYGVENCKIELVELFPCTSRAELHKKGGEYIMNNPCVNKIVAGRRMSQEDYRKEYYQSHKESILEHNAKYRNEHLEQIKAKQKERYETHKERIRASQTEQFTCEQCGGRYQRNDRAKHFRTLKHQSAVSANNSMPS